MNSLESLVLPKSISFLPGLGARVKLVSNIVVPGAPRTPLGIFAVPGYGNLTRNYSLKPAVKGGSGTRLFILNGSLPAGLSFNVTTGEISGTPTQSGTFSGISITVTDYTGEVTSSTFSIIIGVAPVSVSPSGDTTGATDIAAINAQLAAGNSVVLSGAYYANAPIKQVGNTAIYGDSGSWKLIDNANCNIWNNTNQASQTRTDQNMTVVGANNFNFDGNASNQTRQTNTRFTQGFLSISAQNVVFRGFQTNSNCGAFHFLGTISGAVRDIKLNQPNIINTDGVDIGGGCSNIHMENITGHVYDDVVSIYAKAKQSTTMMAAGTVWENGADVSNIIVNNMTVACGVSNMFRLQAGNGLKLTGVYCRNLVNTETAPYAGYNALVQTGEATYLSSAAAAPAPYQISDFIVEGATGFDQWLRIDTSCSEFHVYDIVQDRPISKAISSDEGGGPTAYNISIEGVTDTSAGGHDTFISVSSGVFISLSIIQAVLKSLAKFLVSTKSLEGLTLEDFAVQGGAQPTFSSTPASYGSLFNVTLNGTALDAGASLTPPQTEFTDDFNRADGNLSASAGWALVNGATGGAIISSNMLGSNNTDTNGTAVVAPSIGTGDMYVQAVAKATTRVDSFIAARLMDYKNFIGLRHAPQSSDFELYQKVAGTFTSLGTYADAAGIGKTMRLEVSGLTATVKVNGVAVITAQVSPSLVSSRAGVICRNTVVNPWIDDFACGVLAA